MPSVMPASPHLPGPPHCLSSHQVGLILVAIANCLTIIFMGLYLHEVSDDTATDSPSEKGSIPDKSPQTYSPNHNAAIKVSPLGIHCTN